MSHRMLRSAATVLLASAPLLAIAPAQAAPQGFPCGVGLQQVTSDGSSTITVGVTCDVARTVGVTISAGDTELANVKKDVKAGVTETVSATVPAVSRVCATLETDGASTTVCTR
ncbi:hypothetical protein ACIP6X_16185 [Streptomyces coeruleorubidus]|uniref:hypothetical protein n=1 Tax=Streptomyces coeruleorubidus TaxID=116188 RepID=UPI0038055332